MENALPLIRNAAKKSQRPIRRTVIDKNQLIINILRILKDGTDRQLRLIFQMIIRLEAYCHKRRLFPHTKICYNFTPSKGIFLANLRMFAFRLNFNDFSISETHSFLHIRHYDHTIVWKSGCYMISLCLRCQPGRSLPVLHGVMTSRLR